MTIRQVVEETDTLAGRVFDLTVQALVLLSIASFSIETLPGLSPRAYAILDRIETITVILFTAEYTLRLVVARRRLAFVFSFFGLIDLCAILPFYLALGVDLRSIRAIRLVRVFRLLKIARYSQAINRFRLAFLMIREELVLFGTTTAILLYLAAVGIYYFEHDAQPEAFASIPHSLWWSVVTMTTVGYGDVTPITTGGRIFTGLVLMSGLAIVAVPAGLFASALAKVREMKDDKDEPTPPTIDSN